MGLGPASTAEQFCQHLLSPDFILSEGKNAPGEFTSADLAAG
jgi:hypothetical protein